MRNGTGGAPGAMIPVSRSTVFSRTGSTVPLHKRSVYPALGVRDESKQASLWRRNVLVMGRAGWIRPAPISCALQEQDVVERFIYCSHVWSLSDDKFTIAGAGLL